MANPNPFRIGRSLNNRLNTLTISATPSVAAGGQNNLAELDDVRMSNKTTGSILVYNADLKKFVLQADTVSGGSF